MVEVSAESGNIVEKPESFFEDFDIVLVTGQAKDDLEKLNEHCRKHNVKFFAGDTIGFFGFTFMDLVEHEFVEEVCVKMTKVIWKRINLASFLDRSRSMQNPTWLKTTNLKPKKPK